MYGVQASKKSLKGKEIAKTIKTTYACRLEEESVEPGHKSSLAKLVLEVQPKENGNVLAHFYELTLQNTVTTLAIYLT